MSQQTTTSLEQQVRRIFELFDAMDTAAMAEMLTDDAQGIDEISRRWMRGRQAFEAYFKQLEEMVEGVNSEISDVQTAEWGDVSVLTCVLDQTYRMQGEEQRITAPTSIVFRREGDEWKVAVFHSVALPEPPAG